MNAFGELVAIFQNGLSKLISHLPDDLVFISHWQTNSQKII